MAGSMIQAPVPFRFAGLSAGIKRNGRPDLGLIWSPLPCAYAVAYTSNHARSAHIQWNERHLDPRRLHAVLVNSGNANAATGREGIEDCAAIARSAESVMGLPPGTVALASTGVIGHRLPVGKIQSALPRIHSQLDQDGWKAFSKSIMTTDTRPKVSCRQLHAKAGLCTVLGFAKGAGMISPRLVMPRRRFATMLAFIITDAAVSSGGLRRILSLSLPESFNAISVDGDMSTNDTVMVMASGLVPLRKSEQRAFEQAVAEVMRDLALAIVEDGEGATKHLVIRVAGAKNRGDAEVLARAVGGSALVKTAMYGQDPNWGRILAALGSTRVPIDPEKVDIVIGTCRLFHKGVPTGQAPMHHARRVMKRRCLPILVKVGSGDGQFTLHSTDLSHKYVTINAAYE